MKLHLPKRLFTALLTAITLAAAPAALTLGSAAWGEEITITNGAPASMPGDDKNVAGNTFILNFTTNKYLWSGTSEEYQIYADVQIENAQLSNGYSPRKYTFHGDISGDGDFSFNYYNVHGQQYIFKGDMSAYSGNMAIIVTRNNSGDKPSSFEFDSNKTGTGTIVVNENHNYLYFKGATVQNSAITTTNLQIDTGTSKSETVVGRLAGQAEDGSAISAISTTITASNSVVVASGATLNLVNGSLISSGTLSIAGGAELIIAAGSTMELAHTITGTGTLTLNGTLNLTDISQLSGYSESYSDGVSGFYHTKTAQLTEGTLVQGGGASITVSGLGANATLSFDDKTGYLTATYAAGGTYYVNDTREYSAASMDAATNLNISSTGTLNIGLSDVGRKPISNSGKLNIAAGTENVTLDTLLSADKAITQTATGITSITTRGSVSTSSAIAHTTGTLKIQGESGTSKATLSSTHGWTVGSLELENITATLERSGDQELKLTNLTLNAGATLNITGSSDFVCYTGDAYTWTVNEGAVLWIGTTSAASRQTLGRNFRLVLAGGEVNGKSDGSNGTLDYYNNNETGNASTGGTIEVTKSSTLNAAVRARTGKVIFQIDGSNTVLTMGNTTAGVENYAALTGSGIFEKTGTGTLLYKGSAFSNALAINAGIFEYNTEEERTHTAAISGSGTFKKSGSGTLTLSGALGTDASSRLGNVTAVGGELKLTGTGYVSTLEISGDADVRVATGGNLDVTTFDASTKGINTNRNVYIENGATVTANVFNVAYNMGTVEVDGTLNANTELYLGTNNDDNVVDLLSGTGVINAAKLRAGNWGSYGVNVATLNIGATGLVMEKGAVLNLASSTTTVTGTTTVNSGTELNFNSGSATLNGAVTNSGSFNVNGASVTLNGGVSGTGTVGLTGGTLTLAAGQTNEIALFNYSGGTLNHSGLTVTNATFSGITLDNTANNGTLQLNGTLNVTSTYQLTSDGTGSYVGGAVEGNGFLNTTYLLIQGGSIGYGNGFTVTLGGSAVETVMGAESLKIKLQGQGDFFVNSGVESISTASSALGYRVASGAELIVDTETSMHDLLSGKVTAINGAADAKLTITQSGLNTYDGNGADPTDYSLTSTFAGILELGEGVIFTLGRGDGTDRTANYTQGAVVDLSSLAGLVLRDGAELWYNADGTTTIANVSVSAGDEATIYYKDSKSDNQVQLTGKTQLHGTLNLTTQYDGGIDIKNLVGNGTLNSSGTDVFNTTISSLQYTEGDEISTFTGTLSFVGASNNVVVSTGEGADISLTSLSATGVRAFTLNVQADTTIGSLSASTGTVNVAENMNLNLGIGTDAQASSHSIGTLNAEMGSVSLAADDSLSLGGGVTHKVGTLSMGAGASVSLGENATLKLVNTLPFSHGNYTDGNRDPEASLDLTIQGAAGSMLSLALNTATSWNTNDTIKLRPLTADGGTVESVYIREGALANAVYHNGGAVTDLGGANLTMAGNTKLVLRKALAENTNFGAGTITLEGATDMVLYGSNAYTISNRIEGVNGILNITGDGNASSSITFTNVLQLDTLTSNKNVTLGGGTEQNPLEHNISNLTATGGKLTLAEHAVLNTITSASGVTLTGSGTYKLASGATSMTSGVTLDTAGWTGTVALSNIFQNDGKKALTPLLNGNTIANAKSTVQLTNVQGYFDTSTEVDTHKLLLVNSSTGEAAIKITNGFSNFSDSRPVAVINSIISGSGDIAFKSWIGQTTKEAGYNFTGDVSGWTGSFIVVDESDSKTGNAVVMFSGNATEINASFYNNNTADNKLFLEIGKSDETDEQYVVNGVVNADKLTVLQSADFTNTVTVNDSVTVSADKTAGFYSTLTANTVTNNGQIQLGKIVTNGEEKEMQVVATVTGKQDGPATMSKVQMSSTGSSTGITGTAQDGSSSMSDADIEVLAQDATFTIADMTLTNTSITAATVNIVNSKVSGNVVLNVVKPTADITAPNVGQGGTGEISFTYGLALVDSSSTLTLNMEVPQAILPSDSGLYNLTITLNGFAEDFNFSNIANQVVFGADSWLGKALQGATPVVTVNDPTLGDGAAAAQSASGAPSVSYAATGGNVGSLVITITGLNVPEPTTATLSLLALAALAGRRRRK